MAARNFFWKEMFEMKKFVIGAIIAGSAAALCCCIRMHVKRDRFLEGLVWDGEEDADRHCG